jgi:hypothetical protein
VTTQGRRALTDAEFLNALFNDREEIKDYDYRDEPWFKEGKNKSDAASIVEDAMDGVFNDILKPDVNITLKTGKEIYKNLPETLTCLSVKQPWADLLIRGYKDVENRGWYTDHRGPLLIQSTATPDRHGYNSLKRNGKFKHYLLPNINSYIKQSLIGIVNVVDCTSKSASEWADGFSKWFWEVTDVIEFSKPIFCKGKLSLWKYEDTDRLIRDQIDKVI